MVAQSYDLTKKEHQLYIFSEKLYINCISVKFFKNENNTTLKNFCDKH